MKTSGKRLMALLLLFAAPAAFALTNLVRNPGFEEGIGGGWRGTSRFAAIVTDAHTGAKALKVPSETQHVAIYQDIPVSAGKVYTISGWIKQTTAAGKGASFLYFEYFSTPTITSATKVLHRQFIQHLEGTFGWTQSKVYSLAPDSAMMMRLTLYVSVESPENSVTGYFDDVSVVEGEYMTNKANILTNPGFENGTTGWTNLGSNESASNAVKRNGSYSLRIASENNWNSVYQEVPAVPGDAFGFRGYMCMRTPNGDSATSGWTCWQFSYRDAGNNIINGWMDIDYLNSYSWYLMSKDMLIAPAGTVKFCAEAWVNPSANIGYFDDAYLVKFAKNPNPPSITLRPMRSAAQHGKSLTFYDALGRKILPLSVSRPSLGVYFADREGKWTLARDAKK